MDLGERIAQRLKEERQGRPAAGRWTNWAARSRVSRAMISKIEAPGQARPTAVVCWPGWPMRWGWPCPALMFERARRPEHKRQRARRGRRNGEIRRRATTRRLVSAAPSRRRCRDRRGRPARHRPGSASRRPRRFRIDAQLLLMQGSLQVCIGNRAAEAFARATAPGWRCTSSTNCTTRAWRVRATPGRHASLSIWRSALWPEKAVNGR